MESVCLGLLAAKDPESVERLALITCVIDGSPALLALCGLEQQPLGQLGTTHAY